MINLGKLRNELTDDERKLLDAIWYHFGYAQTWPVAAVVYHEFGKDYVDSFVEKHGSLISLGTPDSLERPRIRLTFLGILLTQSGESLETMIMDYLKYIKERIVIEPELRAVKSWEFKSVAKLNDAQSLSFYQALSLSPFMNGGNLSSSNSEWEAYLPPWIDDLVGVQNIPDLFGDKVKQWVLSGRGRAHAKGQEHTTSNTMGTYHGVHSEADTHDQQLDALISKGESATLEFKETLEVDAKTGTRYPTLVQSALKTIAAFLNTRGGILLIGVANNGEIKGLARDYNILQGNKNSDGFELKLRDLIRDHFDPPPFGSIEIGFDKSGDNEVCRIKVQPFGEVLHYDKAVYVRDGNRTVKLEGRDLTDWFRRVRK